MKKILLMLTMVLVLGFPATVKCLTLKKPWSTSFWQLPIILP